MNNFDFKVVVEKFHSLENHIFIYFFLGRMSTTLMHSYERNGLGIYLRIEGVAKGEVI